jgi:hypothetical protein
VEEVARRIAFTDSWWARAANGELDSDAPLLYFPE